MGRRIQQSLNMFGNYEFKKKILSRATGRVVGRRRRGQRWVHLNGSFWSKFCQWWNDVQRGLSPIYIVLLIQQLLSSRTLWWTEDSPAQSFRILKRRSERSTP